jgi:hypothetical protein
MLDRPMLSKSGFFHVKGLFSYLCLFIAIFFFLLSLVFALFLLHFLVNKTNLLGDENTGEKSEMNDKENNESETRAEAKNDGETKTW